MTDRRPRIGFLGGTAALLLVVGLATGAAHTPRPAEGSGPTAAVRSPQGGPLVTFDDLFLAQDPASRLRIIQERRTLQPNVQAGGGSGPVPTQTIKVLREYLQLGGSSATGEPLFAMELLGIQDGLSATTPTALQSDRFDGHAAYLFQHSGFRVEDPLRAADNYLLVPIGFGSRPLIADFQTAHDQTTSRPANLPVQQLDIRGVLHVALIPKHAGRCPWMLEVDLQSKRILRSVSYDALAQPVCETVVLHESAPPAGASTPTWWQPSRPTSSHPDLATATAQLPSAPWLQPSPSELPGGYVPTEVRVVSEPFGPKVSVIQIFSDGIDELFVIETINGPQALAATGVGSDRVILTYRDRDVDQFLFHLGAIETAVVGRAGHGDLARLASDLMIRTAASGE